MVDSNDNQLWPELMTVKTARHYLDMGPEVFRREIIPNVRAVVTGGRRRWRRADLNRWINEQLGLAKQNNDVDWERLINADLEDTGEK